MSLVLGHRPSPETLALGALVLTSFGCGGATPAPTGPEPIPAPLIAPPPSGGHCRDFELDAERIWSSKTRGEVHAGILSAGGSIDRTIADRVVTKMDGITRNWVMMQENICKDCVERRILSEEAYSKMSVCLRTALVSQQTLATALQSPTVDQVFRVDQSLAKIGDDLKACQNEAVYSSFDERADDAVALQARSHVSRAQVLKDLASYAEARAEAQKARGLAEKLYDPKLFTDTLIMEARIAWDMADYETARRLAQRAEAEARTASYELGQAGAWRLLAYEFSRWGAHEDAFNYAQRALDVRRRLLGDTNPDTAISLADVGSVRYEQGQFAEALAYYQRAYATLHQVLGDEHPRTVSTMNSIAATYQAQKDYMQAMVWYMKAVTVCKSTLGAEHPNTAYAAAGVGDIAIELALYPVAFPMLGSAAIIRNKVYGPNHPYTKLAVDGVQYVCDQGYAAACGFSPSAPDSIDRVSAAMQDGIALLARSQGSSPDP
ncbi:MAG TPA: tetratricopeptide repeat protein [Polyangiaceae bacterium]|nr:tetratricopeptide repeat protein [Polyangiaceae bacterium]